jgi:cell division protein FtsW
MILVCIGVVMIYSSSSIYAWEKYKDGFFFLKRHLSFLFIGAALAFLVMCADYRKFSHMPSPYWYYP